MIDFPITELLDDQACTRWLEEQLHPEGLKCPHCHSERRRTARRQGPFTGYRGQACDRFYTLLSGTIFAKTRQSPAHLVLLLRGAAKGESTARLARELELSRKQAQTLRLRVQQNLYARQPQGVLPGGAFEADKLYQNAGEKKAPRILTLRIRRGVAPTGSLGMGRRRMIARRSFPLSSVAVARCATSSETTPTVATV